MKMHNNSILKLDKTEILVFNQFKFLGIIFNKKLNFILHLPYLKEKMQQSIKTPHCIIAYIEWGADQQTLLKLCTTLIC